MVAPSLHELRHVHRRFKEVHGYYPRLLRPRTFSEFITRRKLFDRNPIYTTFCDKVAARDYVRSICGEDILVPQVWTGVDPEAIPFDTLPYPVILKPRHTSGDTAILRERPDADRQNALRGLAASWVARNYGREHIEPGYYDVPAGLVVDKLLLDEAGRIPDDYKFYVFAGQVELLHVDRDRFSQLRRTFFDRRWQALPLELRFHKIAETPERPHSLEQMIETAERLAKGFEFLRVDMYSLKGRFYFGEITVYPGGGLRLFEPPVWDLRLGQCWRLGTPLE